MKKFTRLWQMILFVAVIFSVAIGQQPITVKDAAKNLSSDQAKLQELQKEFTPQEVIKMQNEGIVNAEVPDSPSEYVDMLTYLGATSPITKPEPSGVYDPKNYPAPTDQGGDDIATAVELTGPLPIVTTGTTTGFNDDYEEVCPYSGGTAPDVVYSFTPSADGSYEISLCNDATNYDTKLYVYDIPDPVTGDAIACNDDACSTASFPSPYVSRITEVALTAGTTYYIVVDGYGANNGDYELSISEVESCVWGVDIECPPGATDEGEPCGDDTNGGCNMDPGTQTWVPVSPTGETFCGTVWADGGSRDTDWYELVLTESSTVVMSLNSDTEVIYGLISGGTGGYLGNPDCGTVTEILPNNIGGPCDETTLDLGVLNPGTYWFFAGTPGTSGFPCDYHYYLTFDIAVVDCPPPADPVFSNATPTSIDFAWTSFSGSSNIEWGPQGFTQGTGTMLMGVTSPQTLSPLTQGSAYELYAQEDCGSGVTSEWVGPIAFYPLPEGDDCADPMPITAPYPTTFNGTNLGATVNCPGVLDWDAVFVEIELPYAQNFVELDLCLDNQPTLSNTGIILLSDCSCDPASFIFSTGEFVVSANCINDLNFLVEGPGTVLFPVFSDPNDEFTLDVNVTERFGVSGVVEYMDAGTKPIDLSPVMLLDASMNVIGQTTTDDFGNYAFGFLESGDYEVMPMTYKPAGGVNILDAINTRQYLGSSFPLDALQQTAADVNSNGSPDILDAIFIQQSLSGPKPAFWTAPDYVFSDGTFTIAGADETVNVTSLCSGDVNASYTPPAGLFLPPGTNCDFPYEIGEFPFTQTGMTTCGFGDDYNSGAGTNPCGSSYMNGEDFVYTFTPDADVTVDITLTNTGTWVGLFVLDGCPDVGNCVDFATNSGGNPVITELDLLGGQMYYIVISTWPSPDCTPFDIAITEWVPGYCIAGVGPSSTIDSNVEQVDISGENSTSISYTGCPGVVGVEDLTATESVDLMVGGSYSIDVTFGTCGGNYGGAGEAWIDFNQNSVFDPGEIIGQSSGEPGTAPWDAPVTFNFTVPGDALTGPTRMRIMQQESGTNPLDPCGSYSWGSVLDVTVNVSP